MYVLLIGWFPTISVSTVEPQFSTRGGLKMIKIISNKTKQALK